MADGQQFIDAVRGDGSLLVDAEDALRSVVEGVKRTGKRGKVTVTLNVSRPKGAEDSVVWLTGAVSSSVPQPDRRDRMFYVTDDGSLSRRDPRQQEMPGFRDVSANNDEQDAPAVAQEG